MVQAAAAILFGVVLAVLVGCDEVESAEVTAKHEQAAQERKSDLRPQDRMALSMPIRCDATATHSGTPGVLPRTRCYVRRGGK